MTREEVLAAIEKETAKRAQMATDAKTRTDGYFNTGAYAALRQVYKLVARIDGEPAK